MANVQGGTVFWNLVVKTDEAKKSVDKLSSSVSGLNKLFGLFKVSVFLKGLQSISKTIGENIMKQSEYIQTQSVFNRTMGESINKANEFRDAMQSKLGMDAKEIMSTMSTFQRLSESFGITSDRAYIMSKNLTQIAADMTTFGYSFTEATTKLRSGLTGQIKGMQSVGVALDENSLQQTLNTLGINKRVDALTKAQKTELVYYQILTKTTKMQGELGRQMITPASAVRIMKQEFTQLARAIGSIFIPIAMKIIPVIRAVTQLLTSAAKAIANFFGFKIGDYTTDFSGFAGAVDDVSTGIEDIGDNAKGAAKEMKKMLMPFDELNNVNFDTGSAGGGGAGTGAVGGGGTLLDNLPEYNIFDSIAGNMEEQVERIKAKIKELMPIFIALGVLLATVWTITQIVKYVEWLGRVEKALSFLGPLGTALKIVASAVMIVVGAFLYFDGIKRILDDTSNGVLALTESLGGLALVVAGVFLLFGGIPALIVGIIGLIGIVVAEIIRHWEEIKAFFEPIANWIYEHIIEPVKTFFEEAWNKISEALSPLIEEIKGAFKEAWEVIKIIWDRVKPYFETLWAGIKKVWSIAVDYFKFIWEGIKGVFSVVGTVISSGFKVAWEMIKAVWNAAVSYFTIVWAGIKAVFSVVKGILTGDFSDAWEAIKNVWNKVGNFFQKVWDGIRAVFSKVVDFFRDTFTTAWEAVKNVFSKGGKVFEGIKEGIVSVFKKIVNGLIDGINNVVAIPFKGIKKALDAIKNVDIMGAKPFSFVPTIEIPKIPHLAMGGIVESGQLFIANESGPELIGNIGNRTAVANSQQITEGIENATYNAMTRALNNSNGNNPYFNVYVGNDKVYSGFSNYQDNVSNRYGVKV